MGLAFCCSRAMRLVACALRLCGAVAALSLQDWGLFLSCTSEKSSVRGKGRCFKVRRMAHTNCSDIRTAAMACGCVVGSGGKRSNPAVAAGAAAGEKCPF